MLQLIPVDIMNTLLIFIKFNNLKSGILLQLMQILLRRKEIEKAHRNDNKTQG